MFYNPEQQPMPTNKETVNQRIARYRKFRGFSQAELAMRIGMKSSTYSQMERGGNISTKRLLLIARELKVEPEVLLMGEESYPPTSAETTRFGQEPVIPWPPVNSTVPTQTVQQKPEVKYEPAFNFSKHEENFIKIYRYISQEDRDEIDRLLNEKYKKTKSPK